MNKSIVLTGIYMSDRGSNCTHTHTSCVTLAQMCASAIERGYVVKFATKKLYKQTSIECGETTNLYNLCIQTEAHGITNCQNDRRNNI